MNTSQSDHSETSSQCDSDYCSSCDSSQCFSEDDGFVVATDFETLSQSLIPEIIGVSYEEAMTVCKPLCHTKICRVKNMTSSQSLIYYCEDCCKDSNCCICPECFKNGNHEGHKYYTKIVWEYTCDCGSQDINPNGYCKYHENRTQPEGEELYRLLPKNLSNYKANLLVQLQNIHDSIEKEDMNGLDTILYCLNKICDIDLYFLLTADILNNYIPDEWKSKLSKELNVKITYFEWFYEKYFTCITTPQLEEFLALFQTDMDLFKFPFEHLYHLQVDSLFLNSNENVINNTFRFRQSKISFIDGFLETTEFERFLDDLIPLTKEILSNANHNYLNNFTTFIYSVFCNCLVEQKKCNLSDVIIDKLVRVFTLLSSYSFMIMEQQFWHKEYDVDDEIVSYFSICIDYISLLEYLQHVFSVETSEKLFYKVEKQLMNELNLYETPVYNAIIDGYSIPCRRVGTNQPITTVNLTLFFYSTLLQSLIKNNIKVNANRTNVMKVITAILIKLKFLNDYSRKRFIKNGDESAYIFNLFYSLNSTSRSYRNALYNTLHILMNYVDLNEFILNFCMIFGVFEQQFEDNKEYTMSELELNEMNLCCMLKEINTITRRDECYMNKEELIKYSIIQCYEFGICSKSKLVKMFGSQFEDEDVIKCMEEVYNSDGTKIKDEYNDVIDPLNLIVYLTTDKVISELVENKELQKKHRYSYASKQSFKSCENLFKCKTLHYFIEKFIYAIDENHASDIIMALMFLLDAKHVIDINEISTISDIGKYIANTFSDIKDMKQAAELIGGTFYESFKSEIKEKPNRKPKSNPADRIKKQMLEKQKQLLEKMNANNEVTKDIDEENNEHKECVVCQIDKPEPLGLLVEFQAFSFPKIQEISEGCNARNIGATITACQHLVHEKCYESISKECPICRFVHNYFMPLPSYLIHATNADIINNFQLLLFVAVRNGIKFNKLCIRTVIGTVISIALAKKKGYVMTEVDKELISSLILAAKIESETDDIDCYYDEHNFLINPFECYITSVIFNKDKKMVNQSLSNEVMMIVYNSNKELLTEEERTNIEKLTSTMSENELKTFTSNISSKEAVFELLKTKLNEEISVVNECFDDINDLTKDIVGSPLHFDTTFTIEMLPLQVNDGDVCHSNMFSLPKDVSFVITKDTISEVFADLTEKQCCNCHNKPKEFKDCKICLKCGEFICDKHECFEQHCEKCIGTKDVSMFLCLADGSYIIICGNVLIKEDMYLNSRGESFNIVSLNSDSYILNKEKAHKFEIDVIRGSIFTDSSREKYALDLN